MNSVYDKYEAVIGLEVHAQLLTKTKNFSADANEYGAEPNTNINVISLGYPGTLPRLNKKTIEFAVKLGVACKCKIRNYMHFARKNYFYADLPKGYQITQDTTPICTEGYVIIKDDNNCDKKIRLTRIHIEEDAGKSIHDIDPFNTLIDLNRAGVPLLEIVTEPDIKTSKEAYNYLTEIRKLVRYLEICDGNMEEGSLRCDANISVMLKGDKKFGTKIEVKNMNSIRNVQRAIEFEIKRQIDLLEQGEALHQETRLFDATKGITIGMRSKERAHDYRYFPEPDLLPVTVSEKYINDIKNSLPPLPYELFQKYTQVYSLPEYDAYVITDHKQTALYFEEIIKYTKNYKAAANWLMGTIKSYLNENGIDIQDFTIAPKQIACIIALVDEGKVSNTVASQNIFPLLIQSPDKEPLTIAQENNLIQESNTEVLMQLVEQAIQNVGNQKVMEYKNGKKGLLGLFMAEVMKLSKGKANPKEANKLLVENLDKI